MRGAQLAVKAQALEHHKRGVLQVRGVQREGHLDVAGLLGGRELGRCGHRVAVGVAKDTLVAAVVSAHVDGSLNRVGLARDKALVVDRVHDGGLLAGSHDVVAVGPVGCRGGDAGKADGLALARDVPVGGHDLPVLEALLEGHDRRPLKACGVKLEGHGNRALGGLGHKGGLGRDGLAVLAHELALVVALGAAHVERAAHEVLLAGGKAVVVNRVDELHGAIRPHDRGAIGRLKRGLDAQGIVVDGPQVVGALVAAHGELDAHEAVALVGVASQLLEQVGAVRKGAQRVVWGRAQRVPAREPYACVGHQARPVHATVCQDRLVVCVRAARVRAYLRGRVEHAVLVGNDDVRLADLLAIGVLEKREPKGHAHKPRHGLAVGLAKAHVAALDLVGGTAAGGERVSHAARLVDGDLLAPRGVEEIALGRRDLAHDVGAKGQQVGGGLGGSVALRGEGGHDLAGSVRGALHHNGLLRGVLHREHGAFELGHAQGQGLAGLAIDLAQTQPAAHDGLAHGAGLRKLEQLVCARGGQLHQRGALGGKVAFGGLGLLDGQGAQRQGNGSVGRLWQGVARHEVRVVEPGLSSIVCGDDPREVGRGRRQLALG